MDSMSATIFSSLSTFRTTSSVSQPSCRMSTQRQLQPSSRRPRQHGDLVASLNRHVPGLVRLCFYRPDSTESHEYVAAFGSGSQVPELVSMTLERQYSLLLPARVLDRCVVPTISMSYALVTQPAARRGVAPCHTMHDPSRCRRGGACGCAKRPLPP